jgi:ELWxxDGT repeat protein
MNSQRRRLALRRRFTSLRMEALEPRLALAAAVGAPSLLADLNPNDGSSNPSAPVVIGNVAYFAANDGTNGVELWKTDGTPGGTQLVKDIRPGPESSNPRSLTSFNGKLYFRASDGFTSDDTNGEELWVSDGTEGGTGRVTDIAAGTQSALPDHLFVANNKLYFTASDIDSGLTANYGPLPYLSAADSPFDQSKLGTDYWLEDFEDGKLNTPGVSADYGFVRSPGSLTDSVDGDDGQIDDNGLDGHSYLVRPEMTGVTFTFDRTVLNGLPSQVGIVLTGGGDDSPGVNVDFFDAGGNLIDTTNDMTPRPVSGVTSDDRFIGMYHSGGISAMRISGPLGPNNAGIEMDHLQYGAVVQPVGTMELWESSGDFSVPTKICDLGYQPNFAMANVNGTLYFTGSDASGGIELWKVAFGVDPVRVADINPGTASSKPRTLTVVDGTLYFVANDGVHGNELWKADANGASLVKDINTGAGGSSIPSIAVLNGILLFSAGELWRSDGTLSGTMRVKDINPSSNGSLPAQFVNVSGTMFFSADDGTHSVELWKTDGTADGTVMVKDITPGDHSSGLHSLTNIGGTLFFAAANGQGTGLELWKSNGTNEGTALVADLNPIGGSAPRDLSVVNNHLVFEANDGTHGWELLTTDLAIFPAGDVDYEATEDTLLAVDIAHGLVASDSGDGLVKNQIQAAVEVGPANGTLIINPDGSFTYQPDADRNGPDGFSYKLTDIQGNSVVRTASLTVKAVNDAPSFVAGADRFVTDISGSRQITHWASNVSAGPPNEAGQTLTFTATADHPELLAVQPKITVTADGYGTLTYTLKPNMVGVVTVTVVLKDDGGTADGGFDQSPPQTFKINISKAHPSHNEVLPLDVDDDGIIAASDALAIINYINANGSGPVDPVKGVAAPYCDINADGQIAADDVLELINHFNSNPLATAAFVGTDTTSLGDWVGKYGADGYSLAKGMTNLPQYAQLFMTGKYDVLEDAASTESRALLYPDSSARFAADWTGHNASSIPLNGFVMDLNLGTGSHKVAIYMEDWNTVNRRQRIDIIDVGSNQILDSRLSDAFHDGQYMVWTLSGHVQIRFTNLANGLNAVASGIFFG